MQVEHDTRLIPIDKFDEELQKLMQEGWRQVPGFPPVAFVTMYRDETTIQQQNQMVQHTSGFGGKLGGHLDDAKIHILRADGKTEPL